MGRKEKERQRERERVGREREKGEERENIYTSYYPAILLLGTPGLGK